MALHEGELFKEKIEVNLDGRQIFSLFCGGAVIASLVFVLGVTVGRRVEAREHTDPSLPGAPASDPLAVLDQVAAEASASDQDLTFASALRSDRDDDPLGAIDVSLDRAPAARPEPAAGAPARPDAKPPEARPDAPRPDAPRAQEAKPAAPKPEPRTVAVALPPAVKPAPPAKVEPVRAAARPDAAAAKALPAAADAARFTLHLSSFQDRPAAEALVARLRRAGYQPTIVESPEPGKGTWYRVRVGRYATFDDAVAGKADFEKKQNIIAYVTRTRR